MVLEAETTIVQSKKGHTQYLLIPAVMVQDSQYPFKEGEKVRITIDPYRKVMMISSVEEPKIKVSSDGFVIRGKKIKIVEG
jgi:hypothetical protein